MKHQDIGEEWSCKMHGSNNDSIHLKAWHIMIFITLEWYKRFFISHSIYLFRVSGDTLYSGTMLDICM